MNLNYYFCSQNHEYNPLALFLTLFVMTRNDTTSFQLTGLREQSTFGQFTSMDSIGVQQESLSEDAFATLPNFIITQPVNSFKPIDRPKPPAVSQWENIIILFAFGLIVGARQLFPRKFSQSILSATANNHLNQMLREWIPVKHILGFVYFLLYVLMFSLLIFHITLMVEPAPGDYYFGPVFYWTICLVVAAVIGMKTALILLLAKLFKTKKQSLNYLSNQFSLLLVGGIYYLALSLALVYGEGGPGLEVSILLMVIFMIYRLIRSFFSALTERTYGLLYLFLYLCALEIMPLLLLAKTIYNFGEGMLKV
jgi:hypothetical protein